MIREVLQRSVAHSLCTVGSSGTSRQGLPEKSTPPRNPKERAPWAGLSFEPSNLELCRAASP